jgi:DNA-binding transcriptional regulator PaaX
MVAPGALQLLKYTPQYKRYAQKKYSVNVALKKAIADGYIEFVDGKKGKYLRITTEGKQRLARISARGLGEEKVKKKRRWDGNWRMVIYDIPSAKKAKRDMLRNALRAYGFVCLQNSVWVHPFECQEIITLLKAEFTVGKNVLYVVADTIENDKQLRAHFGVHYA